MKNRSFLLALALGLFLSGQALLSSEQDIMPSAQLAVEELQEKGRFLFYEYIKDAFEAGKRIDKDYVNSIIALHQLEPYRQTLDDALAQCVSCPCCCSMLSPLLFKYMQDFIELEIMYVDKDFDFGSSFNCDIQVMLCMNQDLLVAYQETMELLIAKGADRTAYDAFMVEFDVYKNSPKVLLFAYFQNYIQFGVVVSDVEDLIREIIYNAPYHLPYDLKEKLSADEDMLAAFQDVMETLIANGFNRTAYDDFMVEFENYKVS